ncbi:MAG: Gldg family protein [Verrucomicrobiota bacterium]
MAVAEEGTEEPAVKKWRWRKSSRSWEVVVQLGSLFVVYLLINGFAFRYFQQADLSRSGRFTLDERTERFLAELDTDFDIVSAYPTGSDVSGDIRSMLDQAEKASEGRVRVEHVDPARQPDRMESLLAQWRVRLRTNSLILRHEDQTMVIADEELVYRDGAGLVKKFAGEIALVAGMIGLIEQEPKRLYFLTGYQRTEDVKPVYEEYRALGQRQNFLVQPLDLGAGTEIPEDADGLLLVSPQVDIPQDHLEQIKGYWGKRGGALFLTLDPEAPIPTLRLFLNRLGIAPRSDRVLTNVRKFGRPARISFSVPVQILGGTPISRDVEGLSMTLPGRSQSLALFPDADAVREDNIHLQPLLIADSRYWGETDYQKPEVKRDRGVDQHAPVYLGALVERGVVDDPNLRVKTQRLVVVSNPELLARPDERQKVESDFVLSSLNWLLDRPALIGIPPKEPTRYAVVMSPLQVDRLEKLATWVLPGLVGGVAFWMWRRRRA